MRTFPLLPDFGRGGPSLRIAYGRIFHEANAFSPLVTEREDFERFHVLSGEEVAAVCPLHRMELAGYLRNAELSGFRQAANLAGGIDAVPLISALTVPSGPLSPQAFEWLVSSLLTRLRAVGAVDGIYLALHGSMRVVGLDRAPEAVLLERIRAELGDVPLAVSYDLHANLSPGIVEPATILCGYRTNPHRDLFQVGFRAGSLLIRTLRSRVRPTRSWRKLPLVLGGGTGIDFLAPMRAVFRRLKAMTRDRRVLDVTLFMVHPFTDAADLGWAVHVTTDDDPALADRLAEELADRAWAVRAAPLPEFRTIRQAVADVGRARLSRTLGAVSLVDTADVVGTGAPGGNTHLLAHLVRDAGGLRFYVPLHDPAVVEQCWPVVPGTPVELVLRGTPGLPDQPAVEWSPTVVTRAQTDFGRCVLLRAGELYVAVTERPPLTLHPKFWRELGLNPYAADAIVQKSFFHYRMFYVLVSRKHVPVASHGASSLENVRRRKFAEPRYPMDELTDWRAGDRALRMDLL
ncbi:MAG: M81 family metallopeptidase [bacterium]